MRNHTLREVKGGAASELRRPRYARAVTPRPEDVMDRPRRFSDRFRLHSDRRKIEIENDDVVLA